MDSRFKHTPGSVFGSASLVAGTTVGAGILAVPFVTVDSGFGAASAAMTGDNPDKALTNYPICSLILSAEPS